MQLTKHHGLGNDFLVALADEVPADTPELARSWCHRTQGIGADGLIFGTPSEDADVDLVMTLFNADGSGAEISGNGIRCLAQAVFRVRPDRRELRIATPAGIRTLVLHGVDGHTAEIEVSMGAVVDGPPLIALEELARPGFELLRAATGDVGNPHVVLLVDDLAAVDPSIDGPAIEAHFKPEGINVHFVTLDQGDVMTVVHWERGAGVTAACGSGATVAATVARGWGLVRHEVRVQMPGGVATVRVGDDATLTGPTAFIAQIEVA